jgi:hypothetical protein
VLRRIKPLDHRTGVFDNSLAFVLIVHLVSPVYVCDLRRAPDGAFAARLRHVDHQDTVLSQTSARESRSAHVSPNFNCRPSVSVCQSDRIGALIGPPGGAIAAGT